MAGETTTDLVTTAPLRTSRSAGELIAQVHTVALRTTDLATNDITGICKVPANSTILGFFFFTDDLDSGSEALVWSILIGTTVVASGITNATAKAGATFFPCAGGPQTVTADTVVSLKATTAAATAVAGNAVLTPIYITSA